jgi:hypothetical protein
LPKPLRDDLVAEDSEGVGERQRREVPVSSPSRSRRSAPYHVCLTVAGTMRDAKVTASSLQTLVLPVRVALALAG